MAPCPSTRNVSPVLRCEPSERERRALGAFGPALVGPEPPHGRDLGPCAAPGLGGPRGAGREGGGPPRPPGARCVGTIRGALTARVSEGTVPQAAAGFRRSGGFGTKVLVTPTPGCGGGAAAPSPPGFTYVDDDDGQRAILGWSALESPARARAPLVHPPWSQRGAPPGLCNRLMHLGDVGCAATANNRGWVLSREGPAPRGRPHAPRGAPTSTSSLDVVCDTPVRPSRSALVRTDQMCERSDTTHRARAARGRLPAMLTSGVRSGGMGVRPDAPANETPGHRLLVRFAELPPIPPRGMVIAAVRCS